MQSAMERAREFLAHRRIAVVGVSRSEKDFSRELLRELLRRGYDAVPVNPAIGQVEGRPCFGRVGGIAPPVEAALLLTPPGRTGEAVRDCLEAGVRRIWLHRGAGRGAASPEAVALCRQGGVEPVQDLCPFMALPGASWFHRLHAFFRRGPARGAEPLPSPRA